MINPIIIVPKHIIINNKNGQKGRGLKWREAWTLKISLINVESNIKENLYYYLVKKDGYVVVNFVLMWRQIWEWQVDSHFKPKYGVSGRLGGGGGVVVDLPPEESADHPVSSIISFSWNNIYLKTILCENFTWNYNIFKKETKNLRF